VGAQAVQALRPQAAVGGQPGVEIGQRLGPDPVQPTLAVGAHLHQAGLLQHPQVLGHRRLAERQRPHQGAHGAFTVAQQVEDAPAVGLGQRLDRRHPGHASVCLYRNISVKA